MQRFELNWHELEKELLKRFDSQLASKKFLTSDKLAWIDICLCCELYQVMASYKSEVPEDYPHLRRWFVEMKELEAMAYVCQQLDELLESEGLNKQEKPTHDSLTNAAAPVS